MRSFFDLVGFEYKKILKRKSVIIVLLLVTLVTIAAPMSIFFGTHYVNGEPFEKQYQSMLKDRDNARTLAGRTIGQQPSTKVSGLLD